MDREQRNIIPYTVELSSVMIAYAGLLFARRPLMRLSGNDVWHALVLISPAIPICGLFWVFWRYYQRLDERGRHLFLVSNAICTGVAVCLTSSYGFVQDAFALPNISIGSAWPVLCGCWFVASMSAAATCSSSRMPSARASQSV